MYKEHSNEGCKLRSDFKYMNQLDLLTINIFLNNINKSFIVLILSELLLYIVTYVFRN